MGEFLEGKCKNEDEKMGFGRFLMEPVSKISNWFLVPVSVPPKSWIGTCPGSCQKFGPVTQCTVNYCEWLSDKGRLTAIGQAQGLAKIIYLPNSQKSIF